MDPENEAQPCSLFLLKSTSNSVKTKQDTFCMVPRNILHSKYSNNKSLAPRFSHIMYAYYKAVTTCAS